jgi:hypothetical protein
MRQPHPNPAVLVPEQRIGGTALPRRWRGLARAGWLLLALLSSSLFVAAVPYRYTHLRAVSPTAAIASDQLRPQDAQALARLGLTPAFYSAYVVTLEVALALVCLTVAAIIVWRKSAEPMALFVSLTLLLTGGFFTPLVSALVARHPIWYTPVFVLRGFFWVGLGSFFYLFPNGRFVPPWTRWLALAWVTYQGCSLLVPPIAPPLSLVTAPTRRELLINLSLVAWLATGVFAQVSRYRHAADPLECQQTKWIVFGYAVGSLLVLSTIVVPLVIFPALREPGVPQMLHRLTGITTLLVVAMLLPLTIAFSIFRYRLWDSDVLINRTLVYGTLTVALALVYGSSVVLLQQLFRPLLGQEHDLAIVVSTLGMALLFQPLRRRLQASIDRRFYRRKYDVAQTLHAFSVQIRDEVDLNRLTEELVAVVEETMQPTHVSLWLRDVPPRRRTDG